MAAQSRKWTCAITDSTCIGGQVSVDHGFVYVSEDSGLTWVAADTWKDGGAARVFVMPQREIYVLSYLGSVRKLAKTDTEWRGEDLILANQDNADQVPYVEKAFAFFFGRPDSI